MVTSSLASTLLTAIPHWVRDIGANHTRPLGSRRAGTWGIPVWRGRQKERQKPESLVRPGALVRNVSQPVSSSLSLCRSSAVVGAFILPRDVQMPWVSTKETHLHLSVMRSKRTKVAGSPHLGALGWKLVPIVPQVLFLGHRQVGGPHAGRVLQKEGEREGTVRAGASQIKQMLLSQQC